MLQQNSTDMWLWRLDPSSGYSVHGVYQMLISQVVQTPNMLSDLIWHKQVPLKVSILVWRLLQNRLPTKDNLLLCGILPHDNQHCVAGCVDNETAQHCYFRVRFLHHCGSRFGLGWTYLQPSRLVCQLIFISLFIQHVDCVLVVLLCSLFGCDVCGLSRMKETIRSSKIRRVPSIGW